MGEPKKSEQKPKKSVWDSLTGAAVEHDPGVPGGTAGLELPSRDEALIAAPANGIDVTTTTEGRQATGDALVRQEAAQRPKSESDAWGKDTLDPGAAADTNADDASARVGQRDMRFARPFDAAAGPPQFVEGEGVSYARGGGKAIYDETFRDAPARSMQGKLDLGELQGQRSDALAGFYKQQSERDTQAAAATKVRAAEDQEQLQLRQQKLEQATQFYTDDLQNQGKFWSNPGNIVSAIAYSLMPIFSNDPTVGVKLINQAIDRDMANRQHAANQTLGALQSNLSGYHKLAGDRQAGDLLAQAEAHRIAAQQVQQIATSFESPIAKKQAEIMVADQLTRARAAQMEYHAAAVHVDSKVVNKAVHDGRVLGGPDGYQRGMGTPTGPTGNSAAGSIAGTPSTASTTGKMSPTTAAIVKVGGLEGISRAQDKGAIPKGEETEEAVRSWLYSKAIAAHKDPNVYKDQEFAKAYDELKPVAEANQKTAPGRVTISNLMTKFAIIEKLESDAGRDPAGFHTWGERYLPALAMEKYRQITSGEPSMAANKAEELSRWRTNAILGLRQETARVINANMHDISGGAVSTTEGGRLKQEIDIDMPWRQQASFLSLKSRELQATVDAATSHLGPVARVLYKNSSNGGKFNNLANPGSPGPAKPQTTSFTPGQFVRAPANNE